jgi:hypothetical protein
MYKKPPSPEDKAICSRIIDLIELLSEERRQSLLIDIFTKLGIRDDILNQLNTKEQIKLKVWFFKLIVSMSMVFLIGTIVIYFMQNDFKSAETYLQFIGNLLKNLSIIINGE